MTSLAVSGRPQDIIDYCTEVRKTGPTDKDSNNLATVRGKSPLMTRRMTAEIFKLRGVAIRLATTVGGLLVELNEQLSFHYTKNDELHPTETKGGGRLTRGRGNSQKILRSVWS